MRSIRRTPEPRTDMEILANQLAMELLAAVAGGQVYRGDDGTDESATAPHLWAGRPVRFQLRRLADDDLIRLPMSGPPKITGYGMGILHQAHGLDS